VLLGAGADPWLSELPRERFVVTEFDRERISEAVDPLRARAAAALWGGGCVTEGDGGVTGLMVGGGFGSDIIDVSTGKSREMKEFSNKRWAYK
jgi:hypothetical protein